MGRAAARRAAGIGGVHTRAVGRARSSRAPPAPQKPPHGTASPRAAAACCPLL